MISNTALRHEIVAALADSLDADTKAYPIPQDQVASKWVMVGAVEWSWQTFEGDRSCAVDLLVGVTRKNIDSLNDLDDLCSPEGPVVQAFAEPPTHADIDSWEVRQVGQQGISEIGGTVYYTAEVALEVFC